MNLFKRMTTLLLALSLVFALAACGEGGKNDQGTADPTESGNTQPVTKLTDEELVEEYKKMLEGYTRELTGLEKDEVLFTVNGVDVSVEEFLYQFTSLCIYYANQYMSRGMVLDLSAAVSEEMTLGEYLVQQAVNNTAYQTILEQKAEELKVPLTEDQLKSWEDALAEFKKTNGESGYAQILAMYGVGEELFHKINTGAFVQDNVVAAIAPEPTEADLDMYIEVSDTLRAKHILLNTVEKDDNGGLKFSVTGAAAVSPEGEAYSGDPDEVNKKILARAEEILKEINGADDPLAKFDELMHANSQDGGLAASPDGYTFTSGEMVEVFENTTRSLEYGEISEVVQSPYGYHIILRLRPDVRDAYINDYMIMQTNAWISTADIQTTELLDKLDPVDIYNKYVEYQGSLAELAG